MNIVRTDNGYCYYIDEFIGRIMLINPVIYNKFKGVKNSKNDSYYDNKISFLKEHNFFSSNKEKESFNRLSEHDIEESFNNSPQLIFEVTDRCNLLCEYCGYGKYYNNYDPRKNINMDFDIFRETILFMEKKWKVQSTNSKKNIRISFYGGEPLLNFKFIKEAVNLIKNLNVNKNFSFSMTTNAIYLKRYIDFLAENKFDILVSIDGDRYEDSYRNFPNGNPSFNIVVNNILYVKEKYPEYYANHIRFNSVLHDRNSVETVSSYIYKTFGKYPMTNELNVFGVRSELQKEFNKMFLSKAESYEKINSQKLAEDLRCSSPKSIEYAKYLNFFNIKQFNKPLSCFFYPESSLKKETRVLPTGTCLPFSKKIFISVTGKIYPCERIGNEINFGSVNEKGVNIDYSSIAKIYNSLMDLYEPNCKKCSRIKNCPVCIASDIEGYKFCHDRYLKKYKENFLKSLISYYEKFPNEYETMLNGIILK